MYGFVKLDGPSGSGSTSYGPLDSVSLANPGTYYFRAYAISPEGCIGSSDFSVTISCYVFGCSGISTCPVSLSLDLTLADPNLPPVVMSPGTGNTSMFPQLSQWESIFSEFDPCSYWGVRGPSTAVGQLGDNWFTIYQLFPWNPDNQTDGSGWGFNEFDYQGFNNYNTNLHILNMVNGCPCGTLYQYSTTFPPFDPSGAEPSFVVSC